MADPVTVPGRPWVLRPADAEQAGTLASLLGCPTSIAHILTSRGLGPADISGFFQPSLDHLHPPSLLLGMDRAVGRIAHAVQARQPILIYGDYDVDGTTATVLLKTAIDRLSPGQPSLVTWHIPHRIREGYGMQGGRLAEAHAAGIRLVISVDTGVRAFAAASEARALGLDLIVTDHHLPDNHAGLPDALAVINPAQPRCPYPFKQLCGAAVAFKLAHALLEWHAAQQADPLAASRTLRERLLPSLLKLVALATVADAVPLVGENRTITTLGLRGLAEPVQPGLRALMEVAGLQPGAPPTATEVGFRLSPRINAAGRMDIADLVVELFLTRSPSRALDLAQQVDQLNQDRKTAEQDALVGIEASLAALAASPAGLPSQCLIFVDPGWHRGVLGILASRVVDRSGLPALVLSREGETCHGSGRSIPGFHLLDALTAVHDPSEMDDLPLPLFSRFGGHAHAVGFSLPAAHLPHLHSRLQAFSSPRLTRDLLIPPVFYDAELAPADLTEDLALWLERCEPFGKDHAEPVLFFKGLTLSAPTRLIKDRHLCLSFIQNPPVQGLAWSRPGHEWTCTPGLPFAPGMRLDLLGRLRRRTSPWFSGLEIEIEHLRPAI